jgi:plastocyanin
MRFDVCVFSTGLMIAALGPAHAADVTVYQEGKNFSETAVTIKPGDTVTFTNKDPVTHNVYSDTPGMAFDLKQQKPGASTTITFDHAGKATVQCAIHPLMKMQVDVQ